MGIMLEELEKEALRIEEDTLHSAKRHLNAGDRWGRMHLLIGLPAALFAGLASCSALKDNAEAASVLAILSTAFITVLTFLKPSERSEMHKIVGGHYLTLRNNARIFRNVELSECEDEKKAKQALITMAKRRDELNQKSPGTAKSDDKKAIKDIKAGRASYEVDQED